MRVSIAVDCHGSNRKLVRTGRCDHFKAKEQVVAFVLRGPFLESPGNISALKSNIQIAIERIRARVLASKLLHFVSLTDSCIMLDAKLLKP